MNVLAAGGSMRPLFKSGDRLEIKKAGFAELKLGDCVAYVEGETLLVHRLWWKTRDTAWIKDDAGLLPLHAVAPAQIRGKIQDARLLSRGWLGLAHGAASTLIFSLLRP